MLPVLDALEARALRWGIVTNKATLYTLPVVEGLALGPQLRWQLLGRRKLSAAAAFAINAGYPVWSAL